MVQTSPIPQAAFVGGSGSNISPKMQAAICTSYGNNFDDILSIQNGIATPTLDDKPPSGFKNGMLIKVLSVALAPGDVRVMSGKTKEFQGKRYDVHMIIYSYVCIYLIATNNILCRAL